MNKASVFFLTSLVSLRWNAAAFGGSALVLSEPSPGEPDRTNTVTVTGATPNLEISLFQSDAKGSGTIGSCTTGLAEPEVIEYATADAAGNVTVTFDVLETEANVPLFLQAVDAKCRTSQIRQVEWRVRQWVGVWHPEVAEIKARGSDEFGVFGSRASIQGDADGDGERDLLISAPRESEFDLSHNGTVYIFSAPTSGTYLADYHEQGELVGTADEDWAGFGLSWAGDLDGDGDDDLWIGARFHDESRGIVYRVDLPVLDAGGVLLDQFPTLVGEEVGDQLGLDIARAPDADGDGLPDLWAAAPLHEASTGRVYLVPATFPAGSVVGDVAITELVGAAEGDQLGLDIDPVGDVDGDGVDDIGLGAANNDTNGENAGVGYLLYRPNGGTYSVRDVDVILWGDAAGDEFGARIGGLGDLDEDGWQDLGVNARGDSTAGEGFGALVLLDGGPLPTEVPVAQANPTRLTGEQALGQSAAHFESCDVDGDGRLDLLVTSHETGLPGPESGRLYLFYGPVPSGDRSLAEADMIIEGNETTQNFGQSLSCADLNRDGFADFLSTAEGDDNPWGGTYSGSAYIYMGRPREGATPTTPTQTDETAESGDTGTGGAPPCCKDDGKKKCGCAAHSGASFAPVWVLLGAMWMRRSVSRHQRRT